MQISAIIPVYNTEPYLERCVDSVLRAGGADLEVILVDDGSPDLCPKICDRLAAEHKNIRVIHKKNGGQTAARRSGLDLASGEYVCLIDSDDFVEAGYFDNFRNAAQGENVNVILCGYGLDDGSSVVRKAPVYQTGYYDRDRIRHEILPTMISTSPFYSFGVFPALYTKCFRRTFLMDVWARIPEDIIIGEDAAIVFSAMLDADSVSVTNGTDYRYQYNPLSVTRSFKKNLPQSTMHLFEVLSKQFAAEGGNIRQQLDEYFVMMSYLVLYNEFAHHQASGMLGHFLDSEAVSRTLALDGLEQRLPLRYRIAFREMKRRHFPLTYAIIRADVLRGRIRRTIRRRNSERSSKNRT